MVSSKKRYSRSTGWLSTLSFGFFLILLGIIWIVTPNFSGEVIDFAKDFHREHLTEHVVLLAPKKSHPVVYTAAMQFCLVFGAFQIVILVLRFIFHDSVNRKSGTISNIAFWFSTSFFLNMLVNKSISWFGFLAGLMISIGLAVIASSVVKLFK
jgi:small-conductance mechanosensitive channel